VPLHNARAFLKKPDFQNSHSMFKPNQGKTLPLKCPGMPICCFYKTHLYTTSSIVELISPTHRSSSSPSSVQSASRRKYSQVTSSPAHEKQSSQSTLTRSFPIHETPFTTHTFPHRSRISFSAYLRRPLRYSHRPSHTPRESFF